MSYHVILRLCLIKSRNVLCLISHLIIMSSSAVGTHFYVTSFGTHEDERTVLLKTISLDSIKPNTNPKTNPNPDTKPNPNRKLTLILTPIELFYAFFEHRPLIFSLARVLYLRKALTLRTFCYALVGDVIRVGGYAFYTTPFLHYVWIHRIHRRQHVTDDAGISKHRLSPYYAYYHNDSL